MLDEYMKNFIANERKLSKNEFHKMRKEYGLTCQDIADAARVTKQTVSNFGKLTSEATEIYLSLVLTQLVFYRCSIVTRKQ